MKIIDKQTKKTRKRNIFTKSYEDPDSIIIKIWYTDHYESFIIDKEERHKIAKFQWCCRKNNKKIIVFNRESGMQLNRYITDNLENKDVFVTFLNGNIHDYRKKNLITSFRRTTMTNSIRCVGDTIEITVRSRKFNNEKIIIDKDDYESIMDLNWHIKRKKNYDYKYAIAHTPEGKQVNLSRLLYSNKKIAHLNGNLLDFRKENIKIIPPTRTTHLKELLLNCYFYLKWSSLTKNECKNLIIDIGSIVNNLKHKKIPNEYNKKILRIYPIREIFTYLQGFALIDKKVVHKLTDYLKDKKVLEVMSGCGSLSYCLKKNGINVIATDNGSWDDKWYSKWNNKIEQIDAVEAVKKYKDADIIIMSWAYMDATAYNVLLTMRKYNPEANMIFIGEDIGGCTADDNFYNNIEIIDKEETEEINNVFKSFIGIHDRVIICK